MFIIFLLKNSQDNLKGNLNLLGKTKKTEKLFSSNGKKKNVDKDGNENIIKISQKIKFFNGERFMASSLSNFCC